MVSNGVEKDNRSLASIGITSSQVYWNLAPDELVRHTVDRGMGQVSDTGALVVSTGKFTGRAPQDRFIVKDEVTSDIVDWGKVNQPFDALRFDTLQAKVVAYLNTKEVYVRDAFACADPDYRIGVRVVTEYPWASMFAWNMFIRPTDEEREAFKPNWHVISAPGFEADPETDGTRQENFAIINFKKRTILIGGTGYTGEIKKGIFSVLNCVLPQEHGILPMHCSANVGSDGHTALFFGLSGTGKTTLSADPKRGLIGDDEHGWNDKGIFNFEGGCYAKCIDLTAEKEPQIFQAIRRGALLENVKFHPGTNTVDYADTSVTQNTRVSYPIGHIENAVVPSVGTPPKHIFFLTCDAFGVLPPISKLTPEQAMYHFVTGYTAKVAGTEDGVKDPQATFSACFGAPFLPMHVGRYAEMLGQKMRESGASVWLVNTGWTGGPFGVGSRIKLRYTRALISAALENKLDQRDFVIDPVFGLRLPLSCPEVPESLLNPRNTWKNPDSYDEKAHHLALRFNQNIEQYAGLSADVLAAGPRIAAKA